ncbi:MAG TPA: pentapeptide repeat-containing protein [Terriglobia bacterium]|nr:pentapeptide repeat-containing protein [Terriglobia bacterium]
MASRKCWSILFTVDLKTILKEVLANHEKWVGTQGKEGARLSIRNAGLQEADLHGANLQDADLEGAKLSVADLMKANLRGANLRNADFWMADMKDANLNGADLQGANLSDVTNLTQTQIDSAITNSTTVLPAGLKHN